MSPAQPSLERRTLIVHAGGGKAGSSALQSALSHAAQDLAKVGITYADTHFSISRYEITSGNGFRLFEEVGEPDWVVRGKSTIESFLGDKTVGVCSSEFLGSLTPKRWQSIVETADHLRVDLKVVYFVRSAVGYLISSYNQNVKRGGEARSVEEAAADYPWQHYDELVDLNAIFDRDHLRVINYDLSRKNIGAAFCAAYDELKPAAKLLHDAAKLPVNRSLTNAELEVVRRVNAQFGALYSHDLSDKLIYDAPEIEADQTLSAEVAEIIAGKFAEATAWINENFFGDGKGMLSLDATPRARKRASVDPPERPLAIALDWALETIDNRSADISFIRQRLLAIDWENSNSPAIPPDFDPIAYLLLNPYVLRAQLAPYAHYIESGKAEARKYRWPLTIDPSTDAPTAEAIARFRLDDSEQLADTPLWPRLRHFLQLESLLHEFAQREHEYLDVIRKLREGHGYESEQFRHGIGELLRPLYELVEGVRREAKSGSHQRAAEARMLAESGREQFDALRADLSRSAEQLAATLRERHSEDLQANLSDWADHLLMQISALREAQSEALQASLREWSDQATQVAALRDAQSEALQSNLSSSVQTLKGEISNLGTAAQLEAVQTSLLKVTDELKSEVSMLRQEQARLNATIEQKDAHLSEQGEQLSRYRAQSFLQFLIWGLQPSKRP